LAGLLTKRGLHVWQAALISLVCIALSALPCW